MLHSIASALAGFCYVMAVLCCLPIVMLRPSRAQNPATRSFENFTSEVVALAMFIGIALFAVLGRILSTLATF